MNNQQGDSLTHRVRQNAPIFPDRDTVKPPLTPRQAKTTSHFLAMGRVAQARQADVPPPLPSAVNAFLKQECSALDKLLGELEARRDAEAAQAAKREARKGQAQRRRELRAAAAQDAEVRAGMQLCDFTPSADMPDALRACYAPKRLTVNLTDGPPSIVDLLDLDALRPKCGKGYGGEGPGELARLLDHLGRHALSVRPGKYRKRGGGWPRQIVLHLSAEMLAAKLGRNVDTVRVWTKALIALGYLDARPHHSRATRNGQQGTVVDGTLYAIRLQPGHKAKLSFKDLSKSYRDLDADRHAGRTAFRVIDRAEWLEQQALEHLTEQSKNGNSVPDGESYIRGSTPALIRAQYLLDQLKTWAVTPGQVQDPLFSDPRIYTPDELAGAVQTVQDVIYLLPTVAETHADKRAALVSILGAALARALNDQHSRRWYCKTIWAAWTTELEGRGGLQVLAAQLARLDVERQEWGTLRRPAALLNARLRAA
ncbi:hypothetical protein ACI3L1_18685 [Deinococcus sp. SM5_A1]|uniref:hypothetical protein n=1 Tax=Deinococcus sp. SM5_A1 TaxID=3379094 RepID=UPI00385B5EAC